MIVDYSFRIIILFVIILLCSYSSNADDRKFTKYPHNRIFNDFLEGGYWDYNYGRLGNNKNTDINYMHVNISMSNHDKIQSVALLDGIFIPNITKGNGRIYHIYSSQEARRCLAGKTVYICGDSYMEQMFIGLGDILLGDPTNVEMHNSPTRNSVCHDRSESLKKITDLHNIDYAFSYCIHGDLNCFMDQFLKIKSQWSRIHAVVLHCLVHDIDIHGTSENSAKNYMLKLGSIFNFTKQGLPLTWATGPSYDISKVPILYKNRTNERPTVRLGFESIELARTVGIPLLDFFTLTDRCIAKNCSSDGGHRARFVNRMKAQMLLNNLCGP